MAKTYRCPDCVATAFHIERDEENRDVFVIKCWSPKKCSKAIIVKEI